jgi:hypothetical protein
MFGNPTIFSPVGSNTQKIAGAVQIKARYLVLGKKGKVSKKPLRVNFANHSILVKLLYIPRK